MSERGYEELRRRQVLEYTIYIEVAAQIREGTLAISDAYTWALEHGKPQNILEGEAVARIAFLRLLYRFHVPDPLVREEYLRLLIEPLTDRALVIKAADLADHQKPEQAFELLRGRVDQLGERWQKSALFQIVRIGMTKEFGDQCLPYAIRLRDLLEEEVRAGRPTDRSVKYALTNLWITRQLIGKEGPKSNAGAVRNVAAKIEKELSDILEQTQSWDAC